MYGQRLRELRKKHKKTQAEIGKILGTDQSGYSKIENDIHSLPISLLGTLANYYGISIDELLEHDPANPKTDKEKAVATLQEYEIAYKNDDQTISFLLPQNITYDVPLDKLPAIVKEIEVKCNDTLSKTKKQVFKSLLITYLSEHLNAEQIDYTDYAIPAMPHKKAEEL